MSTDSRGTGTRLDPWYVTGFIDGEGSFTYSRSGTRRQNFSLYFGVKLGGTDGALLRDLQEFFGVGSIYEPGVGTAKAAHYYRVSDLSDLERVIGHFDAYPLRGMKRASFDLWKEMVRLKQANFRRAPVAQLTALAEALTAAGSRRRKSRPDALPKS